MQIRNGPCAAGLVLSLFVSLSAAAQTRAEEVAKQQDDKAHHLTPYKPNAAETFLDQLEHGKWFIGTPRGWYPTFGSIYPGGGLTGGLGYRHYIGYDSYIDAGALYSIGGDKKIQIVASTPDHLDGRLDLMSAIGWIDGTRRPYYGLGNESDKAQFTTYRITHGFAEGAALLRPVKWLRLRVDGGLDDYDQRRATGTGRPIDEVFTPATAPLLGGNPRYLRAEVSAAAYWLESPGYSRRGGLYRFAYEEFNPVEEGGTFGFVRTEVVQHLPIMRETWVVSLRARTESIVRKSDVVPFFLMPSLGGGNSIRGYLTERFRDRHALLMSSELRWFPNRLGLDMAFFADAGKVAPLRTGLTFDRMRTDVGIGMRFHTPTSTVLRLEVARGWEGLRFVFATSSPF